MFARLAAAVCLVLAVPASAQREAPREPSTPAFLAACEGKEGWVDPSPPVRIFANVFHVGTCGITAVLIASDAGHVLIDGGPPGAAPLIAANIAALGLALDEVEWIVTSHEHHDHVGGVAELKRLTGARLASRQVAKRPLETGTTDWRDPQAAIAEKFAGAPVDRVLQNGEHLVLGPIDLTVHATPGHSPGSTSWSWRACEGNTCRNIVYADSVTAVSADDFRFTSVPTYVDAFARSLGRIAALPCDILITPHPGASALHQRLAGTQPLADPEACLDYALRGQAALETRLAEEDGGQ